MGASDGAKSIILPRVGAADLDPSRPACDTIPHKHRAPLPGILDVRLGADTEESEATRAGEADLVLAASEVAPDPGCVGVVGVRVIKRVGVGRRVRWLLRGGRGAALGG